MMPKHVFGTQNPKLGLFTIFKSHFKRSNKSFKIPKSTQNNAKTCFSTEYPKLGVLTIFKSYLK